MAFISLNLDQLQYVPIRDFMELQLMNTEDVECAVQISIYPSEGIKANNSLSVYWARIINLLGTPISQTYFQRDGNRFFFPRITLKPKETKTIFMDSNYASGFIKLDLPANATFRTDGSMKLKAQSTKPLTIGYQLTYYIDQFVAKDGEVDSGVEFAIYSYPSVFEAIRPEPGDETPNLIPKFEKGVDGLQSPEALELVSRWSKNPEVGQQELTAFLRIARQLSSESHLIGSMNGLFASLGLDTQLSNREMQANEQSPASQVDISPRIVNYVRERGSNRPS